MRPVKHLPRYTVSDYNLWQGDWELIDGIPYAMSPSPIMRHQQLAGSLHLQIGNAIKSQKKTCGNCRVVYELDWIVDDSTVLRPDIAIICDKTGDFITTPPVLIIEVLSASTAFKDRQVKYDIYEEQGVKHYIVVDPGTKTFTTYLLINGGFTESENSTSFPIHDNCIIQLDIEEALKELEE